MTKIGLRDWVILLTLVPTTIIGLVLGAYFTLNRFTELTYFLEEQGTNIVEPLAIASESGLAGNRRSELKRLISLTQLKHSPLVKSIAIFKVDHQLYVTSNYHREFNQLRLKPGESIPENTTIDYQDNYLIFRTPIQGIGSNRGPLQLNQEEPVIGYLVLQINKDKAILEQQAAAITSFSIVILGIILSTFFTLRLVRKVNQPITSMVNAIDHIREGKLDTRVSGQLIGELDLLKSGINAMAKSLSDYREEMQNNVDKATSDLRETLEHIEIQNVELDLAKRRAQDANRVKSEFLANMSHELRTPLNGVIGFTRQLLKTPLNINQKDYLETIENSANSLLSIINDILDFSKLEAGRMALENIPFTLRDTVNEVMSLMAPSAHEKSLELSLRVSPNTPDDLIGDPTRLKQILVNLVGNAVKFTNKGSVSVDIEIVQTQGDKATLKLAVSDTGIGISEDHQASLFAAFGQADSSITRRYGGTGLGLIISQKLAQAMGGDIGFSSRLEQGSMFWFTIDVEQNSLSTSVPLPLEALLNKSVLYYEKDEHTRTATNELLQSWGLNVMLCENEAALSQRVNDSIHYDIAILGHEVSPNVISDIKALINDVLNHCDHLYLVVNTVSPNMREAFIGSGAAGCLSKPINHRKLCNLLATPYLEDSEPALVVHEPTQQSPLKVLAVDDNEANLKLITTLLYDLVTEVEIAHNGAEAVEKCKTTSYDIVFMDIQMPIMDGITACQKIKEASLNEETPIIAVTAHALAGEKEKMLEAGFNGYLTKPIDDEMLRQAIIEYGHQSLASPTTKEEYIQTEVEFPESHSVDWELALQRAGGKPDLAFEMLKMLVDSIPESKQAIQSALDESDQVATITHVHKLHGACCYSGVPRLKQLTEAIETQMKQGASIEAVEPEIFELLDEMENLYDEVNQWELA
ncbi:two-component sensor histidine kinase BarA [Flocculibacter collagenilyticus]|uniref:two-component sensor histidine kinase BarA n=1 Tax=Flocculibacter collagenilyticus TaxID=2744479 RepID=UPI0018F4F73F|nr:two-component sensor histidine kinase BarA [Flocculibacter collagenilyticus]